MGWVIMGVMVLGVAVFAIIAGRGGKPGHEVHRHYSKIHMRESTSSEAKTEPGPDFTKPAS
jgi:hypothetical protein